MKKSRFVFTALWKERSAHRRRGNTVYGVYRRRDSKSDPTTILLRRLDGFPAYEGVAATPEGERKVYGNTRDETATKAFDLLETA